MTQIQVNTEFWVQLLNSESLWEHQLAKYITHGGMKNALNKKQHENWEKYEAYIIPVGHSMYEVSVGVVARC